MGETATGIYYPAPDDPFRPASVDMKKLAESIDSKRLTASKGKVLVGQNTGPAAWEAMKGDATLAEDGTLTLVAARKPVTWYAPKEITAEQAREAPSAGTLPTADEIAGVVVPANGLLRITYTAQVKSSVSGQGGVGIYVGANEMAGFSGWSGTTFKRAITKSTGELEIAGTGSTVTTGRIVGTMEIGELAAGTYSVAVKFYASSGSVTAKERVLRVSVHGV